MAELTDWSVVHETIRSMKQMTVISIQHRCTGRSYARCALKSNADRKMKESNIRIRAFHEKDDLYIVKLGL